MLSNTKLYPGKSVCQSSKKKILPQRLQNFTKPNLLCASTASSTNCCIEVHYPHFLNIFLIFRGAEQIYNHLETKRSFAITHSIYTFFLQQGYVSWQTWHHSFCLDIELVLSNNNGPLDGIDR